MQEIIRIANKEIDRASVYRSVDIFEESGIAQRIYSGWKYKIELSDIFQEHHHHFTCLNCGKVYPIHDESIERIINQLAEAEQFKITSHQLEIQGNCSQCR
jgi:Fur family ferric uptake transcriptional regulator